MSCNCRDGGQLVLLGKDGITVTGSGTAADPFSASLSSGSSRALRLEVRDTATVNLTSFGSGTIDDPVVLQADTASAASLQGLGDVSTATPVVQGSVPMWIGPTNGGRFEFRLPGTRYTTSATRGTGRFQGEVIKETDTGKRYEWDGTQYVSLDIVLPAQTTVDFSGVMINRGGVSASTNWNTLLTPGMYRIQTWDGGMNTPPGAYNFGTLEIAVSGNSVTQRYSAHQGGAYMYWRTKWNDSDWSGWVRSFSGSEGDALTGRTSALETRAGNIENGNSQTNQRVSNLENNSSVLQSGSVNYASNVYANNGVDLTRVSVNTVLRFNLRIDGGKNINEPLIQMPNGFRPRNYPADGFAHNGIDIWGVAIDPDGWLRLRTHSIGGGGLWGTIPYQSAT